MNWGCRDGFDIAGPERTAVDLELALDDGSMGDDIGVDLDDEMHPAHRVLPVVLSEALILV